METFIITMCVTRRVVIITILRDSNGPLVVQIQPFPHQINKNKRPERKELSVFPPACKYISQDNVCRENKTYYLGFSLDQQGIYQLPVSIPSAINQNNHCALFSGSSSKTHKKSKQPKNPSKQQKIRFYYNLLFNAESSNKTN